MPLEILKCSNNKETLKVNTITNACENGKYLWTNTCRVNDSTLDQSAIDYTMTYTVYQEVFYPTQ
jgi:hypothetical protein